MEVAPQITFNTCYWTLASNATRIVTSNDVGTLTCIKKKTLVIQNR